MNRSFASILGACASLLVLCTVSSTATAIDRDTIMVRAKGFAFHPWRVTSNNLTASCSSNYQSVYSPGDYMGLPYDWGGYMTLFEFDQQIAAGAGAGSYPQDGVLACTAGLDCSGFVSKSWDTGHFSTSTLHQTSSVIGQNQMLPGDIYNDAGHHVVLYSHTLGNGDPIFYEAVGYNTHISAPGWSWVNGYLPRRFNKVSGTTVSNPVGTAQNPIPITSFPFSDQRDTSASKSDILDGCGVAPSKKETGPEYIYRFTVSTPGVLTATIQDDVGVDIDVHLYSSTNTGDCFARHDSTIQKTLDCGTYYLVADTFKGSKEYPGTYTLSVDWTPNGQGCGSGPPSYDFEGQLGDPCAYPGDESLPFCNENLGAKACIYNDTTSFCSKPCKVDGDCGEFPSGCCKPVGGGELYCMVASLCGSGSGGGTDTEPPPDPDGDPGAGGGPSSSSVGQTSVTSSGAGGAPSAPSASSDDDDDGSHSTSAGCSLQPQKTPSDRPWWMAAVMITVAAARRRRDRFPTISKRS